jgi:prepilin-type N-terminal cleavage/methylation domain-containing protein
LQYGGRFGRALPAPARTAAPRRSLYSSAAFTLVEVMFAMVIVGFLVVALYAAIATSASWVRLCQENEAATQILSEKLDTIRLYNWDQIRSNGFIQTNFTVGIDPIQTNNTPYYTGTVAIVTNAITETYKTGLVQVTVKLDWVSGNRPQTRSMTTFVNVYGIQSFVNRN